MTHVCSKQATTWHQLVRNFFFFKSNRGLLRNSDSSNNIMPKHIREYASDTELLRQRTAGSSYNTACYFVLISANSMEQQHFSGLAVVMMVK